MGLLVELLIEAGNHESVVHIVLFDEKKVKTGKSF